MLFAIILFVLFPRAVDVVLSLSFSVADDHRVDNWDKTSKKKWNAHDYATHVEICCARARALLPNTSRSTCRLTTMTVATTALTTWPMFCNRCVPPSDRTRFSQPTNSWPLKYDCPGDRSRCATCSLAIVTRTDVQQISQPRKMFSQTQRHGHIPFASQTTTTMLPSKMHLLNIAPRYVHISYLSYSILIYRVDFIIHLLTELKRKHRASERRRGKYIGRNHSGGVVYYIYSVPSHKIKEMLPTPSTI